MSQPALPAGVPWPDVTKQWWAACADLDLNAVQWAYLLDTALLHADVWGNWNLDRLPELRTRLAKFGATPVDLAELARSDSRYAPKSREASTVDDLASRRASRRAAASGQ